MTAGERAEVREMIHGVLSGWHAETVAREEITNMALKNIDEHLKALNGKVFEHQKIIYDNLPHSIAHCPQTEKIQSLSDSMISEKTVKKTLYVGFGILGGLIAMLWGIVEIFFK